MVEPWTDNSMRHLIVALNEAKRRNNVALEPEHLFWADLQDADGIAARAASIDNLSSGAVKSVVADLLSNLPVANSGVRTKPQYSPRLKGMLSEARKVSGEDRPLDWPSVISALMSDPGDPLVAALRRAGMETANMQPLAELPASGRPPPLTGSAGTRLPSSAGI